jgi:hypothetical protein
MRSNDLSDWRCLKLLLVITIIFTLPCSAAQLPNHEVIARFDAREVLGLDWQRTLVTYPVTLQGKQRKPEQLQVMDADGKEQPFQISHVAYDEKTKVTKARLSFFAELPKNGSYHYELRAGTRRTLSSPVAAKNDGEYLVLDNGVVAIRLPKAGDFHFNTPLKFGQSQAEMVKVYGKQVENGIAPGPIQGVRLVDGRWVGGSYFWAANIQNAPQVTGYNCQVTEQGPLFTEATVRYTFNNGFQYEMTARVLKDDPAIRLDEQYDFGSGGLWDYRLMVSLASGWQEGGWKPDAAYWGSVQNRVGGSYDTLKSAVVATGVDEKVLNQRGFGSRQIAYNQTYAKMFDLAVRYPWAPDVQYFGLVNPADITREAAQNQNIPFLGVAPLHPGNWRGSAGELDGMVFSYDNGDVGLNWSLHVPPHPQTVLHTGEYDPALPLSFGRRQWALVGGSFQSVEKLNALRAYEGFVNLDDYKDWVLDWPSDPKVTYPRLVFSKSDVERLKPSISKLPGADELKTFLYFNDSDARRQILLANLNADSDWSGPFGQARGILTRSAPDVGPMPWETHYRYSQMAGWVGDMDELLSSDKLTPEQRTRLRSQIAALCNLLAEPDVNPRGSLIHLGNPNMPINRFMALPWAASLIPDHPEAKTWLDISEKYIRYKLAMNTAPGGAWSELITYFNASAPSIMQTAAVLAEAKRLDPSTARLAVAPALFTTSLLTPRDPRFNARIVPGWGHEGVDNTFHYLVSAVVMRDLDPKAAEALAWSWDQTGRPMSGHHDAGFSKRVQVYAELVNKLQPNYIPPQLQSTWLPGLGATLRAHAGQPDETYLSLRNGYMTSHSDPNQGDFVLWAKGAPLITTSLFGYAIDQGGPFDKLHKAFGWHNRPRFGAQTNDGGWPGGGVYGGVPAHAFNDSSDYLRAVGTYGPNRWTRQISFMKGQAATGPDYFIFRDSFDPANGDPKTLQQKWWYLRTLGEKTQIQAGANELNYTSAFGPKMNVRFLQPAAITAESRDAAQSGPLYFDNARAWEKAGSPIQKKNNTDNITVEEKMTVTAVGPLAPGQDVLAVLYPYGNNEAPPQYESLGDGAAKISNGESVDYVFLDRKPMKYSAGDIAFEGVAGAVRVFPNEVHLIISEGPGSITYKGATLRSTQPAIKIVPRAQIAKQQVFDVPVPVSKLGSTPLPDGYRIAGNSRCEVTAEKDRIIGKSEGEGGFLYAPMPPELKVLPTLVIDGQTYAPGSPGGNQLIIPLMPGEHSFEVRALEQPPIFRNWQAW